MKVTEGSSTRKPVSDLPSSVTPSQITMAGVITPAVAVLPVSDIRASAGLLTYASSLCLPLD